MTKTTQEQIDAPLHPTHALHIVDNWGGEKSRYWVFAFEKDGVFYSYETLEPILDYEGDVILQEVRLDKQLQVTNEEAKEILEWLAVIAPDLEKAGYHKEGYLWQIETLRQALTQRVESVDVEKIKGISIHVRSEIERLKTQGYSLVKTNGA